MERPDRDLAVDILITKGCVDRNRDSILCRIVADVFLCGWKGHGGILPLNLQESSILKRGVLYVMSDDVI